MQVWLGELDDIVAKVQQGDPTIGWEGDPTLDVYAFGHQIEVRGFDTRGDRYVAARADARIPGWSWELLRKLRDGHPKRLDRLVADITANNDKITKERERKWAEKRAEGIDRILSAAPKGVLNDFKRAHSERVERLRSSKH